MRDGDESTVPRAVRVSVEMTSAAYRDLRRLAGDLADDLGVPRVTHTELINALLQECSGHADLRSRVIRRLADIRADRFAARDGAE